VIQRVIAELHGRQRHRLGWSEAQLAREQFLFAEALGQFAHSQISGDVGDRSAAMEILERLTSRSASVSLRAFRHAAQAEGEGYDMGHLTLVPGRMDGVADRVVRRQTPRESGAPSANAQRC
jgi:hypothetical protein